MSEGVKVALRGLGAALAIAGVALAIVFTVVALTGITEPGEPTRTTFEDSGRICTQVVLGGAVDIDCDYPPGEARLDSFLDKFRTTEP